MAKVNSCNCGFSFDVIEVHNDHVVKQCPMCDQIMCEEIEPRKPFDISEHEFNDINISMSGNILTVKYEEWCGHLDGYNDTELDIELNKADAIAIAKALGVTGEDLG